MIYRMKYLFYLIILVFIFTSCSKDKIDYRKPLCGEYEVFYTSYSWVIISDSGGTSHREEAHDTITSNSTISKSLSSDNTIDLSYSIKRLDTIFYDLSTIEANENNEYILSSSPTGSYQGYSQNIYIKNDSIYIRQGANFRTYVSEQILKGSKIN